MVATELETKRGTLLSTEALCDYLGFMTPLAPHHPPLEAWAASTLSPAPDPHTRIKPARGLHRPQLISVVSFLLVSLPISSPDGAFPEGPTAMLSPDCLV